jgi:transposase
MQTKSLIKQLLGVAKTIIKSWYIEETITGINRLIVKVTPMKAHRSRCGICGRKSPGYDPGHGIRRWRSPDISDLEVWLEAPAPRVKCAEHGVTVASVPWARHGSGFTLRFEDMVTWLAVGAPKTIVSAWMRIAWKTVGDIASRVYDSLSGKIEDRFDNLINIAIDETSYKKGHRYLTVIANNDTGHIIWVKEGHGKKALDDFFMGLTEEQRASIRVVSADGARYIAESVKEHCPNAVRCLDPFHAVKWVNEALDALRRRLRKENANKVRGGAEATESTAQNIGGSRYAYLKNPEDLTEAQRVQLELTVELDKELTRGYKLKEMFRSIFKLPYEEAMEMLKRWISWAQRCRLPEFMELCRKVKRHIEAIKKTLELKQSNARIEALNNVIKVISRMAYGFRNIGNLISMIMLKCSGIKIVKPGISVNR